MFKINQVFSQHSELKPLLVEAEARQQLQQLWARVVPEFALHTQVLAWSSNILTITAFSGVVANRIRLLESELLRRLHENNQKSKQIKGLNLSAIRVKVQVKNAPQVRQKRIPPLSAKALQSLQQYANVTENSALQASLHRLLTHQSQGLK